MEHIGALLGGIVADLAAKQSAADGPPLDKGFHLKAGEGAAWDVYFAAIVSMQMHPRNALPPNLEQCGIWADWMVLERRRRKLCP